MEEIDQENPPKSFSVKCEDPLWDRVRRAAKFSEFRSVKEYCWAVIATSVSAAEDDMIFGPDGEVIGDEFDLPRNGVSMN
jgi:hypothetical protein